VRSIAILLLTAVCGACGPRAMPAPPEPAPAPVARPHRSPPLPEVCGCPPGAVCRCIRICVVQNGRLREVPVRYNTRPGDTLTVDGLPFSSLAPLTGEYASVAGWYVNREPIMVRGRPFARYGLPRVLGINEVTKVGEYRDVGLYAEAQDTASAARVVYLPTRPGCEFQPYMPVDSIPSPRQ
jgi:hypothetical protein